MTASRRSALRLLAAALFSAALAVGAAPLVPGSATAAASPIGYAGKTSAAGVQFSIDTAPPAVPVQGLFDVRSPTGTSTLTSAGEAEGVASLAHPGNAGNGFILFCGADPNAAAFCDGLSQVTSQTPFGQFPIDYPLAARATYPTDDEKPVHATVGNPAPIGDGPVRMFPGEAQARATQTEVTTSSSMTSSSFLTGLPAALSTGSVQATTRQVVKDGVLATEARATLKDVVIAGVIRIASIETVATASNDGHGRMKKDGKATVSGVTAMGMPATIDEKGISINDQGDGGQLAGTLNKALQEQLAASGVSVRLVGVDTSATKNAVSVSAGGVLMTYERKVNQQPDPTDALRELVSCIPADDPCLLGVPSPNATYFGSYMLGNAAVDDYAAPLPTFDLDSLFPGGLGGLPGKPGTTTFVPGTPGTPGDVIAPLDPGGVAADVGGALEPAVAGDEAAAQQARVVLAGDVLRGTSDELERLFPVLFLAALGVIAGRLDRYPARLPGR